MHNDLFTIGNITIHGYGLMIALGFLSAILTCEYRTKSKNLQKDFIWDIAVTAIIGGLLGAKLLFIITDIKNIIDNPSILLNISNGFVVYGGIIGGILAGFLLCKIKKQNFFDYFDLIMPSVFIAQGFGRIGCLLAGCCYGMEYLGFGALTFSHSEYAPSGVSLFPTQVVSSIFDFTMGILLIYLSNKKVFSKRGTIGSLYLIIYGIGRIIIEFFRGDMLRGFVMGLSTSQFISLFIILIGVILLILTTKGIFNKEKMEAK